MELDPTVTTALKRRAFLGRGMAGAVKARLEAG